MCNDIRQNIVNIDPEYNNTRSSSPKIGLSHDALLARFTDDYSAYLKVANLHKETRIKNAELEVRELELEVRKLELKQQKAMLTRRSPRL
jgi:hypothetical protein